MRVFYRQMAVLAMVAMCTLVTGCVSTPVATVKSAPVPGLTFLDIQKFDRDLAAALEAGIDRVEISFYDPVSPNALPERIEKWVSAAQAQGGKVTVLPPPGEPTPKSPIALIGLIGSAVSAAKAMAAIQQDRLLTNARKRDVLVLLERDTTTQRVQVAKVVLTKAADAGK